MEDTNTEGTVFQMINICALNSHLLLILVVHTQDIYKTFNVTS